jgi:hypothetical protein
MSKIPRIELEDPHENIGAKLGEKVAQKTNDVAGDGTTTATISGPNRRRCRDGDGAGATAGMSF